MATLKDIANKAGVSTGTVSRILSNDHNLKVSPDTRKKVLCIAEEMHYVGRKVKSENTLGKVLSITSHRKKIEISDLFNHSLVWGVETSLSNAGYQIDQITFEEKSIDYSEYNGILAIGDFDEAALLSLKSADIPIVFLNSNTLGSDLSCVTIDFKNAVNKIMHYLLNEGHKYIGLIAANSSFYQSKNILDPRITHYIDIAKEKDIYDTKFIFHGDFSIQSGYQAMTEAIENLGEELPSAFFCISDAMAIGALRALKDHNISSPKDVRIIGFGNIEIGEYMTPKLSTIDPHPGQMGRSGSFVLQNMIKGLQLYPVNVVTSTDLIIRES